MIERALEENPDWVYNDLAPWDYHTLPAALGCKDWFTAKVATLGELDAALAEAATGGIGLLHRGCLRTNGLACGIGVRQPASRGRCTAIADRFQGTRILADRHLGKQSARM